MPLTAEDRAKDVNETTVSGKYTKAILILKATSRGKSLQPFDLTAYVFHIVIAPEIWESVLALRKEFEIIDEDEESLSALSTVGMILDGLIVSRVVPGTLRLPNALSMFEICHHLLFICERCVISAIVSAPIGIRRVASRSCHVVRAQSQSLLFPFSQPAALRRNLCHIQSLRVSNA